MSYVKVGAENGADIEIYYEDHGQGRPVGYDYDTFAADLAALLDHLDLADAALVGFSMGTGEVTYFESFFNDFYNVDKLAPERISDRAWQAGFNVAAGPHRSPPTPAWTPG